MAHKKSPPIRKTSLAGLESIRVRYEIPTQKALADRIGISEMQVSQIVRGQTTAMTLAVMDKILNAFPEVGIQDIVVVRSVPAP